mmetsp:Transcript_16257/g.23821  ORF Transcript_16257/g.23821 Transcript_16257/m.23821 type:complete len:160 (+) Transcript_16257:1100-1579(+)
MCIVDLALISGSKIILSSVPNFPAFGTRKTKRGQSNSNHASTTSLTRNKKKGMKTPRIQTQTPNNDDDPDESHHSISERLWHVADVETFLDRTSGEGDLSSSVVLELLTDLATTTQHGPTLDRLQEFWEEEEDDENARNDLLLDIYCRFHSHFTTNPNT